MEKSDFADIFRLYKTIKDILLAGYTQLTPTRMIHLKLTTTYLEKKILLLVYQKINVDTSDLVKRWTLLVIPEIK